MARRHPHGHVAQVLVALAQAFQAISPRLFLLVGKGLFPFRWRGKWVLSPDTLAEKRRVWPIAVEE